MVALSFYAESLMEDVMAKQFDDNGANCAANVSNCTAPGSLGYDSGRGETAGNSSVYNDIDDYNNTTDVVIVSPANGITRSVYVSYAVLNANVWQSSNVARADCKLVTVTANRAGHNMNVTLTGMKIR